MSTVLLAAALFVFIQSFEILSPFLLSLLLIILISLAVNPIVVRIRSWTGGRAVATAVLMTAVVLIFVLAGWAFYEPMKKSVSKLSDKVPQYWERLQKPLIKMEKRAEISEEKLQAEVSEEIVREDGEDPLARRAGRRSAPEPEPDQETFSLRPKLGEGFRNIVGRFMAVVFDATKILVVLVTVFFGVMFMLMNPRPIFGAMFALVPEQHHAKALRIMQRIGKFVPRWAGATLLGMLTIGVLVFLLMWPIFGFTDALALGLTAGLLEAIPFAGPVLSGIPALLLAIGKGGMAPWWVILAYVGVQTFESNVSTPLIMSHTMRLHPVAVIFSMFLCVAAFGALGVLVAAPVVAILAILHEELYRKRFLPNVTDGRLDQLAGGVLNGRKPREPDA